MDEFKEGGKLLDGAYGSVQLFGLMCGYGFMLMNAATLIGDGAELLLLVPSMATLVGTLVLPVLGAVPDGAIVFFSGLGPTAQDDLSVGMGALAGSTIMLLTIPWFLSIFAGRVDIVGGQCRYKAPRGAKKLSEGASAGDCGVQPDHAVKTSCTLMLITSFTYLIIQFPANFLSSGPISELHPNSTHHTGDIAHESGFALFGLIVSVSMFFGCCIFFVKNGDSAENQAQIETLTQRQQLLALDEGLMNFTGMFREELLGHAMGAGFTAMGAGMGAGLMDSEFTTSVSGGGSPTSGVSAQHKVEKFLRPIFNRYDVDKSGDIDVHELRQLFKDLGVSGKGGLDEVEIQAIIQKYDADQNGLISFDEFITVMIGVAKGEHMYTPRAAAAGSPALVPPTVPAAGPGVSAGVSAGGFEGGGIDEDDGSEEEEEEEMPEDLAGLSPEEQQTRIKRRAFGKMAMGTILVLLFSDPMCGCLSALGERTGIPPFYVSFVLAPLASNGTELLAAYTFALKKSRKSVTVSLSQLEGAAIMNNTFCLAIFLFLIWLQDLEWAYTAETVVILTVQLAVAYFARKPVQTLTDGYIILSFFPLSIVAIALLEGVLGLA